MNNKKMLGLTADTKNYMKFFKHYADLKCSVCICFGTTSVNVKNYETIKNSSLMTSDIVDVIFLTSLF